MVALQLELHYGGVKLDMNTKVFKGFPNTLRPSITCQYPRVIEVLLEDTIGYGGLKMVGFQTEFQKA